VGDDAGMTENIPKFSQALIKVSKIFVVVMPVFSVIFYLWMHFRIPLIFFLDNYNNISYYGALALVIGYGLTVFILVFAIFAMMLSRNANIPKIGIFSAVMFVVTIPLCCLSSMLPLYIPTVLDAKKIDHDTYYLTGELMPFKSRAFSRLYKCNNINRQCEQTIFFDGAGGAGFRPLHLMIDKLDSPDEVNVIYTGHDGFERLEFTYGAQSRYYDYPAQLNSHLYYLAYNRNIEPKLTTFWLFKCNLDNTSCVQLPIMYEGTGYLRYTKLNIDEKTSEISVYIDDEIGQDTLIFTWGENPRCYVQGCEILEGNK
jgi:hypothetical protein